MPARIGRLSAGVGRRHPVTVRVVDGRVDKAGMSTAAPNRSAVLCSRMDQGQGGCSQRCCASAQTGASKPPQECDA